MILDITGWVLASFSAFALLLTLFNLLFWPRGNPKHASSTHVSVLIPARNEENTIENAVRAVFSSTVRPHEVIVCDDRSTDKTPEILEALQKEFKELRVIQGTPLPQGWIGKPYACEQLAQAAKGDVFLYLDADTRIEETGIARILSLFAEMQADLVTAVPRQETVSFFERLVVPILYITYCNWLPIPLVWRSKDARFLAANGQIMAIEREAYEETGGFASVRRELVDDMAIARLIKSNGRRVVFADGFSIASCRMYEDARGVWEGFSKNIFEGIGGSLVALLGIVALFAATYIVPFVGLAAAPLFSPSWIAPMLLAVVCNLVMRLLLAFRLQQPLDSAFLHPFGVLALLAIAFNSYLWTRAGKLRWRGRVYLAREAREPGGKP